MNTHKGHPIPDDEIDFGSLGRKIGNIIAWPFRLLISNIKTTLAFVVVAVALAVTLKYILPKTYRSSFLFRPTDTSDKLYARVLADLPYLFRTKEYTTLSSLLDLKESDLSKILALRPKLFSYKAGQDSSNYTEVIIETLDPSLFIPFQNAVLKYLESNEYYAKIKQLQQSQIGLAMDHIDQDLPQLDSLKKLQLDHLAGNAPVKNEVAFATLMNASAVYSVSIDRIDRKARLMAQNVFIDRFQLIKGCVVSKYPASPPRILVMCLYTVPFFLVLCFLFLLIKIRWQKRTLPA